MAVQSLLEAFLNRSVRLFIDDSVVSEQCQKDENPPFTISSTIYDSFALPSFAFSHPMFVFITVQPADMTPLQWIGWCRHIDCISTRNSTHIILSIFTFVNYTVLTLYMTYPSKNTSLKTDTTGGRNMQEATLFIIQ
jgi:hypothetical protein